MSAEEDADLRDLVAHTLESNGVLGKIKAELRAKVFMVLEAHDKNETNQLLVVNEKLRNFMNTKEGRLVTGLVREFMEFFELDYTLAVFDPESNFGDRYQGRASLVEELNVGDVGGSSKPVLSSLLENSTQATPKLDYAALSEDKSKKGRTSPEISPRSSSLSSGSRNNSPRISRIPQRVKEKKKEEKTDTKAKTITPETTPPEETKTGLKLGNADLSFNDDDDLLAEFTKPRNRRSKEKETKKGFSLDEDISLTSQDDQWLQPVNNIGSFKTGSLLPGSKDSNALSPHTADLKNLAEIDRRINELGSLGFGRPAEDKSGTDDYKLDSYADDFHSSSHSIDENSIQEELEGDPLSMGSFHSEGSKADDLTSDRVVSPLDFKDLDYNEEVEDF